VVALIVYVLENQADDATASFWNGFVQLSLSSWPIHLSFNRQSWPFALGVASRLVLIVGSFVGIVTIFEAMIKQRRLPMRYADLLTLREQTIRDKFLSAVPATDQQKVAYQELLVKVAQEADQDLFAQLKDLFGAAEARRILERKQQAESANL
jgi:hypothetical protein